MEIEILFDSYKHEYFVDGIKIPSVSEILKTTGIVDDKFFNEKSASYGKFIHSMLEHYDNSELDEDYLKEKDFNILTQYKKFLSDFQIDIIEVEKKIFNKEYFYAGTYDRLAVSQKTGHMFLIDIKTGSVAKSHAIQLAAYAMCINFPVVRIGLYLTESSYKVRKFEDEGDKHIFKSAITVHRYITK